MNTKIALSAKELELVCDTGWILTKHAIIKKLYDLLGEVLPVMEKILTDNKAFLPGEIFIHPAKISKGENYQLLPYVILDYPRYFSKENSIAIRTFFWWGNFFSVTLQVGGNLKERMHEKLEEYFVMLQQQDYSVCVNESPWEHHYQPDNYVSLSSISQTEFLDILTNKAFVKLSKKIAVERWPAVPAFIVMAFSELAALLQNDQAPRR